MLDCWQIIGEQLPVGAWDLKWSTPKPIQLIDGPGWLILADNFCSQLSSQNVWNNSCSVSCGSIFCCHQTFAWSMVASIHTIPLLWHVPSYPENRMLDLLGFLPSLTIVFFIIVGFLYPKKLRNPTDVVIIPTFCWLLSNQILNPKELSLGTTSGHLLGTFIKVSLAPAARIFCRCSSSTQRPGAAARTGCGRTVAMCWLMTSTTTRYYK